MLRLLAFGLVWLLTGTAFGQFGLSRVDIIHQEKRAQAMGTACLIDGDLVITCFHTVDGKNWRVQFGDNIYTGTVIASSDKDELALVRLDRKVQGHRPVTIGALSLGETVRIGGFAGEATGWRYQTGHVEARGVNAMRGFSTSIGGVIVRPGDSGGPVLDAHGNLAAIVWAYQARKNKDTDDIVPGSESAIVTEVSGFLNEHLPGNPLWSKFAGVDPYYETKREILWRFREKQLESFISGSNLPVPAPIFELE